ncbi:MAG: TIGR02281 family clan AA aspartic protease [Rhodobacteraceae bacterium]|nr:TIGR02281 family clan AA aspartic protease [Paracoccaceae bacterium]
MSGDDRAYLFYLSILLFFIAGSFLLKRRKRFSQTVQQAAIWGLIFAGVILAYGFSDTLRNQLLPSRAVQINAESYTLERQRDGHFYLTLKVNNQPIEFIIDTGASQIVLSKADAHEIGFDPEALAYLGRATTANGQVKTASVVLDLIEFGEISDQGIRAAVNGGDMEGSLLGMTYLSRFQELSIRGNTLTLTR